MKKTCSIRLLIGTVLVAAALGSCAGFFAGTMKKWNVYEKRIAFLEQERQEQTEESLNVVQPYEYILLEEKGYVAVYHKDRKTLYASTDIKVQELPEELQEEIYKGKYISSEEQLYNFLENYSS